MFEMPLTSTPAVIGHLTELFSSQGTPKEVSLTRAYSLNPENSIHLLTNTVLHTPHQTLTTSSRMALYKGT